MKRKAATVVSKRGGEEEITINRNKKKRDGQKEKEVTTRRKKIEEKLLEGAASELNSITESTTTTHMEKFLRSFIAIRFEEYFNSCILSQVSETISGLIIDSFEPRVTDMIIRCATPQHGILFSLKTYLGAIDTLSNDVLCVIASRYDYGSNWKKMTKIELRFEEEPLTTFLHYETINVLAREDTRVNSDRNLLALFNDKNLSYLSGYRESERKTVFLYSAYMNNILLTSMIIPSSSLNYYLNPVDTTTSITSQTTMQERYKKNFISLKESETKILQLQKLLDEKKAKQIELDSYIKDLISANATLTELNRNFQEELDEC